MANAWFAYKGQIYEIWLIWKAGSRPFQPSSSRILFSTQSEVTCVWRKVCRHRVTSWRVKSDKICNFTLSNNMGSHKTATHHKGTVGDTKGGSNFWGKVNVSGWIDQVDQLQTKSDERANWGQNSNDANSTAEYVARWWSQKQTVLEFRHFESSSVPKFANTSQKLRIHQATED